MAKCTVAGCNNEIHARGYCQKHYKQSQNHKSILPDKRQNKDNDWLRLSSGFTGQDLITWNCLLELVYQNQQRR